MIKPVLEPAAQAFIEATASPPYLSDLGPVEGRKIVDQMGIVHDFVMLNAWRGTQAAEAAISQAVAFLAQVLRP